MKCAIISDLHFGDPGCSLVICDKKAQKKFIINQEFYSKLKNTIGTGNDYLVLLGDIFDFAICEYSAVYDIAEKFFSQIKKDNLAREIIYLPGNHDFNMWHIVEHEVNTINRLKEAQEPQPFRFSVPAIIDDRKKAPVKGLSLAGVKKHKTGGSGYGGLFLDYITVKVDPRKKKNEELVKKQQTTFNIAYPNLYLVTDNDLILVTHGHYFEKVWSLVGLLLPHLAGDDPVVGKKLEKLNLTDLVSINFPICQLTSSGVGQAGIFTYLATKIEEDVKSGKMTLTEKYFKRAAGYFLRSSENRKWYHHILDYISKRIINFSIKIIVRKVKNEEGAAMDKILKDKSPKNKTQRQAVLDRINRFIHATNLEIKEILKINKYPTKIIFGHTHKPIPLNEPDPPKAENGYYSIPMYNTGGWLSEPNHDGSTKFCGATIFLYETGKGLSSVLIE